MSVNASAAMAHLLDFLTNLEAHRIHYHLEHNRSESLMVTIAVPGERWEVEFMDDGQVEVERFFSDGKITGEETLAALFIEHGRANMTP